MKHPNNQSEIKSLALEFIANKDIEGLDRLFQNGLDGEQINFKDLSFLEAAFQNKDFNVLSLILMQTQSLFEIEEFLQKKLLASCALGDIGTIDYLTNPDQLPEHHPLLSINFSHLVKAIEGRQPLVFDYLLDNESRIFDRAFKYQKNIPQLLRSALAHNLPTIATRLINDSRESVNFSISNNYLIRKMVECDYVECLALITDTDKGYTLPTHVTKVNFQSQQEEISFFKTACSHKAAQTAHHLVEHNLLTLDIQQMMICAIMGNSDTMVSYFLKDSAYTQACHEESFKAEIFKFSCQHAKHKVTHYMLADKDLQIIHNPEVQAYIEQHNFPEKTSVVAVFEKMRLQEELKSGTKQSQKTTHKL